LPLNASLIQYKTSQKKLAQLKQVYCYMHIKILTKRDMMQWLMLLVGNKAHRLALLMLMTALVPDIDAQGQLQADTNTYFVNVAAGPEYKRGGLHKWLFGKNRRKEWIH
jgi:hypothetical protein